MTDMPTMTPLKEHPPVWIAIRNVQSPQMASNILGCVNAAEWRGYPLRSLLVRSVDGICVCQDYWHLLLDCVYAEGTWDLSTPDGVSSFQVYKPFDFDTLGKVEVITTPERLFEVRQELGFSL